ncbi:MAG: leucine-rich repeat domain-containing protein, partial [Planctomycetes bacterium]|nr:leucine-rich repeat domain-containing protein [Planctomycetota bacterium]
CTFTGNSADNGIGSAMDNFTSSPTMIGCILWSNATIYASNEIHNYFSTPVISYSDIAGCGGSGGGWVAALGTDGGGNIDEDPMFVDADGADDVAGTEDDDLRLSVGSPCIEAGDNSVITEATDLDGNPRIFDGDGNLTAVVDMGAYESQFIDSELVIVYVDQDAVSGDDDGTSWSNAYLNLQDALAVAVSGDEIWVAAGVYRPDDGALVVVGDREATFQLKSGVGVYGAYAGFGELEPDSWDVNLYETVLSGDLAGDDGEILFVDELLTDPGRGENSYHVVTASGTDSAAVLDGFTIMGGNANGEGHENGGGVYNDGGDATISFCYFIENQALWYGGAITNESASYDIYGCVFFMNTADNGGAIDNYSSGGEVRYCSFVENLAIGGGAVLNYGSGSDANFTECNFQMNWANYGGAMANWSSSNPKIVACDFEANGAEYGGAVDLWENDGASFVNSRFFGNWADGAGWGGVAFGWDGDAAFMNCLFSGNSSYRRGGALYSYANCSITIDDCTFSDNATVDGGSIACDSHGPDNASAIEINNSILWSGGDEIWNGDRSVITISYSAVQDGAAGDGTVYAGDGNIDVDPQFIDADGADDLVGTEDDDLRLALDSPCIDAGDNTAVPADVADLDDDGNVGERLPMDLAGWWRFTDEPNTVNTGVADLPKYSAIVDMGAYETAGEVYFADANLKAAVEAELGVTNPSPGDMLALEFLDASGLEIVDLVGLEIATNLVELYLWDNQIVDISVLSELKDLIVLALGGNQIVDISALSGLTSLIDLSLTSNSIVNISALSELKSLVYLSLRDNQIIDITALSGLTDMIFLELSFNQIVNISALSELTGLTYLYLGENQIVNLDGLSELTGLAELDLVFNQIVSISALSDLTNLTYLYLAENQISDISILSGLINLSDLGLWSNRIIDISALTSLDSLTKLYLDINYLNAAAYCVDMDVISGNNPGLILVYDPNPNPIMDDCSTDLGDLALFGAGWLMTGCDEGNGWCGGADFDHLDDVTDADLVEFAGYWLADI